MKSSLSKYFTTFFLEKQSIGTIHTGKSLSEALIFASTNPQYDNRLFIVHRNFGTQKVLQMLRASEKDLPVHSKQF